MKLVIVDLGYGNIGSVQYAFDRLGVQAQPSRDPALIEAADRIVLPGVGAAGHAMTRIGQLGLGETLKAIRQPALGICLGMQLLFDRSEEGCVDCLGILPGEVRALTCAPGLPVPHMGWSALTVGDPEIGLATGDYVYFAHSFAADDTASTIATVDHGRTIPAVVRKDNWLGAQFHPERSGQAGARFLEAFLA